MVEVLAEIDPQVFYKIQGIISTLATVLVVFHMNIYWPEIVQRSEKLRYIALLGFSLLLLYASREQILHNIPVESRNIFAIALMAFLLVTMIYSIRETRKSKK